MSGKCPRRKNVCLYWTRKVSEVKIPQTIIALQFYFLPNMANQIILESKIQNVSNCDEMKFTYVPK